MLAYFLLPFPVVGIFSLFYLILKYEARYQVKLSYLDTCLMVVVQLTFSMILMECLYGQ